MDLVSEKLTNHNTSEKNKEISFDEVYKFEHYNVLDVCTAVTHINRTIKNSNYIGLKFFGDLTCRNGEIGLVCINYDNCTYLFDLVEMRNREENSDLMFMTVLSSILSSKKIVKVNSLFFLNFTLIIL